MKRFVAISLALFFAACSATRSAAPKTPPAAVPAVTDETVLPGEVVVEHPLFPLAIMVSGKTVGFVDYNEKVDQEAKVLRLKPLGNSNILPVRLGGEDRKGDRHWAVYLENGMYGMAYYENGKYHKIRIDHGNFTKSNTCLIPSCLPDPGLGEFCGTALRWKFGSFGVALMPNSLKVQEVPTSVKAQKVQPLKVQEASP